MPFFNQNMHTHLEKYHLAILGHRHVSHRGFNDLIGYSYTSFGKVIKSLAHFLITFWLCQVFLAARGLSLVAESGGYSLVAACRLLNCGLTAGFSHCGAWALGAQASGVVAYEFSCSVAHRIFLHQGLNLSLLHWQTDSHPLYHQGSPCPFLSWVA